MTAGLKSNDYSSEQLGKSLFSILNNVELCSLATVGPAEESHISTAYFCFTDDLDFYFVSDPGTTHGQYIAQHPQIAVAIFDTAQRWGDPLRGVQLFGRCHLASIAESPRALATHAARFHAYGEYIKALNPFEREKSPYKFFVFRPCTVKLLDESAFGEETFVTAEVVRK